MSEGLFRSADPVRTCTVLELPEEQLEEAGAVAVKVYPANAPFNETDPKRIGVVASKWWGDRVRDQTVGFMERPSMQLIEMILSYANSWGEFSKARFRYTANLSEAIHRITFARGGGYSSYVGTNCLLIPTNRHTMSLEAITVNTPVAECKRVIPHEFGHGLGCPHEQQRRAVIAKLKKEAVYARYKTLYGWSRYTVDAQVFVPLEEFSIMGASPIDVESIMCYHFDADLTIDGVAIPGGLDFSPVDKKFFALIYPPDQAPPVATGRPATVIILDDAGREIGRVGK